MSSIKSVLCCALVCATCLLAGDPLSPAERAIATAHASIAKDNTKADGYNALALALARRARETSEARFYDEAEAAVQKSLVLATDNTEALRARCWILLGKHEFAKALALAKTLNARMPDDPVIYGLLVDANVELGQYDEAEKAAQWALDLSRNGIPALTRTAYLREIFGDVEGALELMRAVYSRLNPAESEDRAWTLVQIASLFTKTGKLDEAQAVLEQAHQLFPDYHYALAARARLESARRNHDSAAKLMQRRYELAPHPENLFDVATALHRAGREGEAKAAFQKFERLAVAESEGWDNANRELIAWYTDFANRPADALSLAKREITRRRDIGTLDAYAWSLYRSRRTQEAAATIDKVLAVGTVDPLILYHAATIYRAAGDRVKARTFLQKSLAINPHSEVATDVRNMLRTL